MLNWIFYSISSLKKQSAGKHVISLRHIIPILIQPVFDLTSESYVLSGEADSSKYRFHNLSIDQIWAPSIYRTRSEHINHYTIDAVPSIQWMRNIHYLAFYQNSIIFCVKWNSSLETISLAQMERAVISASHKFKRSIRKVWYVMCNLIKIVCTLLHLSIWIYTNI